jgi:FkbM family methyltransferase
MNDFFGGLKQLLRRTFRRTTPSYNRWQNAQNAFMCECFREFNVQPRGVIHVGGHFGEEYPIYKEAGARKIIFFEPMSETFAELKRQVGKKSDVMLVHKALGHKEELREIYVNRGTGESTSFLQPTDLYEGHFEDVRRLIPVTTLDVFLDGLDEKEGFDTLITDTQGFDLQVLHGATKSLEQIRYVYTEVSCGHYHGEPTITEFDSFLSRFGFRRVAASMYGNWKGNDQWGDVFYMKDETP